jgi:hypothetical protein
MRLLSHQRQQQEFSYFISGSDGGTGAVGVDPTGGPLDDEGLKDGIGGAAGNEGVDKAGVGTGGGELEGAEPLPIGGSGTALEEAGAKAEGTVLGAVGAAAGALPSSSCAGIPLGTS